MHKLCPGTWKDACVGTQPTNPGCWALPASQREAHRYPALSALRDKALWKQTYSMRNFKKRQGLFGLSKPGTLQTDEKEDCLSSAQLR